MSFVLKMKLLRFWWMETQAAVLENLPLSKSPQLTESNTSFCNYPQENINQLNQNIIFKR